MRVARGLPSLRSETVFVVLRGAIRAGQRQDFRVTHFSIQRDHVHMLVEAADGPALSSGMRGLAIRMARRLNVLLRRRGTVWCDRWHGHELASPREVRNALMYVLFNGTKHGAVPLGLDPCASVYWCADVFADSAYRTLLGSSSRARDNPVEPARTWLLHAGWRRLGLLRVTDLRRKSATV